MGFSLKIKQKQTKKKGTCINNIILFFFLTRKIFFYDETASDQYFLFLWATQWDGIMYCFDCMHITTEGMYEAIC